MDFKLIERPKQRHLEDLLLFIRDEEPGGLAALYGADAPLFHGAGVVARAAVRAEWLVEPQLSAQDIGELDWEDVDELASAVIEAYKERVVTPKNS